MGNFEDVSVLAAKLKILPEWLLAQSMSQVLIEPGSFFSEASGTGKTKSQINPEGKPRKKNH